MHLLERQENSIDRREPHVETMLSPALAMVAIAMNCADCPLDAATAVAPPSSAATRFSNTS